MTSFLLASFLTLLAIGFVGGLSLLLLVLLRRDAILPKSAHNVDGVSRLLVRLSVVWSVAISIWIGVQSGINILPQALVPIMLALIPFGAQHPRAFVLACASSATVLSVLSFVAGFSIGTAYPMSAALLVAAGAVQFARLGGFELGSIRGAGAR